MSGDENKPEKITIYIKSRTFNLLEKEARRTGRSMSAMADYALHRYLALGVVYVPVRDGEEIAIGGLTIQDVKKE